MKNGQKILITTGIYPPKIGGPAQYAKNLKEAFEKKGFRVAVKTFSLEDYLPSGFRHLFFFFKIIPEVLSSEVVFALDTFSVGLPTVLVCKIFGKKCVIRVGGDFLWEQYVERTRKKVLLKNFYQTEKNNFSKKEKIIFNLTSWVLKNVSHIIFSTDWQRQIFADGYNMSLSKTSMVENYYGPKESDDGQYGSKKVFVGSGRNLELKNFSLLEKVFADLKKENEDLEIFTKNIPFSNFVEKIKNCYAVILISLGDISPNLILDAVRYNKPFICTKETGIYERIKEVGIFVDPLDEKEIKEAILGLLTEEGYKKAKEKVRNFNFIHTWGEIAEEFLQVFNNLKK